MGLVKLLGELDLAQNKQTLIDELIKLSKWCGYSVVETNTDKPWGAYVRFSNDDAERFVKGFFPEMSIEEAKLGNLDAPLSPKLIYVSPSQRLSWQRHRRRAERWLFLTAGAYYKSETEEMGEIQHADAGEVVQFAQKEFHRLVAEQTPVLVAEIWQHSNADNLSDEEDIIRYQDDYSRLDS